MTELSVFKVDTAHVELYEKARCRQRDVPFVLQT